MQSKTCSRCKETKATTLFYRDKRKKDGLQGHCKQCNNAQSANWAKSNPEARNKIHRRWVSANQEGRTSYMNAYNEAYKERSRDLHLQRNYGLTVESWNALFASQGNACAVCKGTESKPFWHTDHCHSTGKVRGILCHGCNVLLGFSQDNTAVLQSAIDYLQTHQ